MPIPSSSAMDVMPLIAALTRAVTSVVADVKTTFWSLPSSAACGVRRAAW